MCRKDDALADWGLVMVVSWLMMIYGVNFDYLELGKAPAAAELTSEPHQQQHQQQRAHVTHRGGGGGGGAGICRFYGSRSGKFLFLQVLQPESVFLVVA